MAGEKFVDIMQKIAKDYASSNSMTDILYGVVTSVSPLKIKVDNRFEISANFIVLSSLVKKKTIILPDDTELTLWDNLAVGESVSLIRHNGGQKFFVIDRR